MNQFVCSEKKRCPAWTDRILWKSRWDDARGPKAALVSNKCWKAIWKSKSHCYWLIHHNCRNSSLVQRSQYQIIAQSKLFSQLRFDFPILSLRSFWALIKLRMSLG
jgi:hypothetical protein